MRRVYIFLSMISIVYALDKNQKDLAVECANSKLKSCEAILKGDIPSVKACNVRTECEFIGWLYSQVQDYDRSLPYLQKACNNNHVDGCDKLGFSYERTGDYKKSVKYYKIACNKGSRSGCYNMATMYYNGLGVRQNFKNANDIYKKICEDGDGQGCLSLAMSYINGSGLAIDTRSAMEYLKKGCDLGNNNACDKLDTYSQPGSIDTEDINTDL